MPSAVATASTNFLLATVENRCSCYNLTKASPIADSRIREIIESAVKHTPSAFNVQSTRAVVLVKQDHEKLWDIGDAALKSAMPEQAYAALAPKIQGFRAAYGTVLWFEDQSALDALKEKNPAIQHVIPQWSGHSNGMHQFLVWTALELEGLGCNLQHYNFMPEFRHKVQAEWDIPSTWALHSQLVFGTPADGLKRSRERTYLPLEDRVKMFGGK
ncbi:uncharacterized protein Z520_01967 [Fonsecaea multimorphosa CBS 102226]|uniref:Nitroreductase domain-containing protein n=1 Tax=Fonsecaea multimorphosa CBS 102226 TaxID=1442371 RepID=A0A0D2KYB0_9EURO|nr:uncharacterized protein Z520_01967 [Fonsecaea multimorphosa CBS 102226]KIY01829.1 hypothetical protein Z520_01967 [Fonsecaea multimorphosa CBS 102226]OAL30019.1 hypothetical protein AYO22_01925 [Fonsecaea multimorphosa]